MDINSNECLK